MLKLQYFGHLMRRTDSLEKEMEAGNSTDISTDGDCHEIKRLLLLGRKVMTNLDSMLKSRDITLSTKVRLVKVISCTDVRVGL